MKLQGIQTTWSYVDVDPRENRDAFDCTVSIPLCGYNDNGLHWF